MTTTASRLQLLARLTVVAATAAAVVLAGTVTVPATTSTAVERAGTEDEVVLLDPPPDLERPDAPRVTLVDTTYSEVVEVRNPGGAVTPDAQCTNVKRLYEGADLGTVSIEPWDQLCMGKTPPGALDPEDIEVITPIGTPRAHFNRGLSWIIDEAKTAITALHDLSDRAMVGRYAQPEIRAYVYARLLDILDKKVYGEPMTAREKTTYAFIEEEFRDRNLKQAKAVLREYRKWVHNPCGYEAPEVPPGVEADFIPNDIRQSASCHKGGRMAKLFDYTLNTPPVETFEAWAAYRNPSPLLRELGDPQTQMMLARTYSGLAGFGGISAVLATATLGGVIGKLAPAVAAPMLHSIKLAGFAIARGTISAAAQASIGASMMAAVVGAVVAVVVTTAIAIWTVLEEDAIGKEIKSRVTEAGGEDPLGMGPAQQRYENLSYEESERPDDLALVHRKPFQRQLFAVVMERMMLDIYGDLVPDELGGYDDVPPRASDKRFRVNDQVRDTVAVVAPDDAVDRQGRSISGYRVHVSRGWLMVAPYRDGGWGPARPQLSVDYVDAEGRAARMSLIAHADEEGRTVRAFSLTAIAEEADDGEQAVVQDGEISETWTYRSPDGLRTATLVAQGSLNPVVSVLPTVQGVMFPGRTLTFRANPSDAILGDPDSSYTWTIERFDDDGEVAETLPSPPGDRLMGFQKHFDEPGSYRATVLLEGDDGAPYTAKGSVDFTIAVPEPQPATFAEPPGLIDLRKNDGTLRLDLRLTQPTPSDTFEVEVDWAYDIDTGATITRTYQVTCEAIGDGTCDSYPAPGGGYVNERWSQAPVFELPEDQNVLPVVKVRVTNSHGGTWQQTFEVPENHRPQFLDRTPYVPMAVGTDSEVLLGEVEPSPMYTNQEVTIHPYIEHLNEELPDGVTVRSRMVDGRLQILATGTPMTTSLGPRLITVPAEQQPWGLGRKATPALVTLDVRASASPGHRAVLTNVPGAYSDRFYGSSYPNYHVAVGGRSADGSALPEFAGQVRCRLVQFGRTILDRPCEPNRPFPWPDEVQTGTYEATVEVVSGDHPISEDGVFTARFFVTDDPPDDAADLALTTSHQGTPGVGDEVTVVHEVSNHGSAEAESVTVYDPLPNGLTLVGDVGAGWTCDDGTCVLDGPLAAAADAPPLTLTAEVEPTAYPAVTTGAQVWSTTLDSQPANDSDEHRIEVPPLVDLAVAHEPAEDLEVGEQATLRLLVTNGGPTDAPGAITLTEELPPGLELLGTTGPGWECGDGGAIDCVLEQGLGAGETAELTATVRVGPGAHPRVARTATVRSEFEDKNPANNSVTSQWPVSGVADVEIEKSVGARDGTDVVYEVIVTNKGTAATAAPIVVRDDLPDGVRLDAVQARAWTCDSDPGGIECLYDEPLAPDGSATLTIDTTITATDGRDITNVATVRTGRSENNAVDDEDEARITAPDRQDASDAGPPGKDGEPGPGGTGPDDIDSAASGAGSSGRGDIAGSRGQGSRDSGDMADSSGQGRAESHGRGALPGTGGPIWWLLVVGLVSIAAGGALRRRFRAMR